MEGALKGMGATVESGLPRHALQKHMRTFVETRKVLLVIDNVWDAEQLDTLLPTRFHEDSVVIITCRSQTLPASEALIQVRMHAQDLNYS